MRKITLKISKPVIYIFIIIMSVVVVLAVLEIMHSYQKYSWKKNTRLEAEAKLQGEVNKIQKVILSIEQIPQNLAYVLEFSNPKMDELRVLLNAVVANNDEVFGTCIAYEPREYDKDTVYYAPYIYKKDGRMYSMDPTDTNYQYFTMDWYLIPKTLNKPVWIEPYFDEGSTGGNIVLSTYSVPFYSYDGTNETKKGIIAVDISIDWLSKIISNLRLSDGSYSVLLSENGTIISAPNPEWPYNETIFSLAEEKKLPGLREIGRNLQKGKSGFVDAGKLGTNRNWWAYYMPIPANNWGVLLIVPEE
jgi:sigma-B regulation protein RsbU (phosphoserine phosphatase)